MIAIRVNLQGQRKLIRTLDRMDKNVRKKVLISACRQSFKPILKDSRSLVKPHDRTGLLRKSLGMVVRRYRSGNAGALIGVRKGFKKVIYRKLIGLREMRDENLVLSRGVKIPVNPRQYAHLLERGTRPHVIRIPKVPSGASKRQFVVRHPGSPPRPFMRPAFDRGYRKAQVDFGKHVWNAISAEAARGKKAR